MKKRLPENKGLPPRWRKTRNAYYYQVPPGMERAWDGKKTFKLGNTLHEASAEWAKRMEKTGKSRTLNEVFDRYQIEVIPKKAPKTRKDNVKQLARLRPVFGHLSPEDTIPQLIYKYYATRSAKVAAKREIALLSHCLTKSVEWGDIDKHPFKGEVRLEGETPRDRYVEDWEIVEALGLKPVRKKGSVRLIQAYIRIKLLTGMARSDLLRLKESDLVKEGIKVTRHKTKDRRAKTIIYSWTSELRQAVEDLREQRFVDISGYLISNRQGYCYFDEETGEASGWDSMWQRFMERLIAETKIKERFTEHDLRAKCASDAESLQHAQKLLAHADSKLTDRVYRRKPEIVKPLR